MRRWITTLLLMLGAALMAQTFIAVRTWYVHGAYYPPGTLGYTVWTELTVRAAGDTNAWRVWNNYDATDPYTLSNNIAWNSNSVLFSAEGVLARGATGISIGRTDAAGSNYIQNGRMTAFNRRIATVSGHYTPYYTGELGGFVGYRVLFLQTNNTIYTATVARAVSNLDGEDRLFVVFSNDLPAGITPMRIAGALSLYTNANYIGPVQYQLPWNTIEFQNSAVASPIKYVCQHGFLVNSPAHSTIAGGDSGSPGFVLLSNELLYAAGISIAQPSSNFISRANTLLTEAGLDPAQYPIEFVSLTNFPLWPY
jgi:hypothetical protein